MADSSRQNKTLALFLDNLRRITVDWRPLLNLTKQFAIAASASGAFQSETDARLRVEITELIPPAPVGSAPDDVESRIALRIVTIFVAETLTFGLANAIARCIDEITETARPAALFRTINVFLDEGGLRRRLESGDLDQLAAKLKANPPPPESLSNCLRMIGLNRKLPTDHRNEVVTRVILPLMRHAAKDNKIDLALKIEDALYEEHIKVLENPKNYLDNFRAIESALEDIPHTPLSFSNPPGEIPKVAFILPNGYPLAHTDVLLSFLEGLKTSSRAIIDPVVYMYADRHGGHLGTILSRMQVEWRSAQVRGDSFEEIFERTRSDLTTMGIDAVVVVSLTTRLAYFCKCPLAPVQLWWPMKFPLPLFDNLQGRVDHGSIVRHSRMIDGKLWRGGPTAIPRPARPDREIVKAIRNQYSGKKILGVIAREEKIAEQDFLDAIVQILRRHPDTVFLWTGRERLAAIDLAFQNGGIADRCHFVGWIDPTTYIEAFDVMLETYPLTGLVVAWAMTMGTPVISIGDNGWLGVYLKPIFDGAIALSPEDRAKIDTIFEPIKSRLPGIWASTLEEIEPFADALLEDKEFRQIVARVQKEYVDTFMFDKVESAEIFAQHIVDVVNETWAASVSATSAKG